MDQGTEGRISMNAGARSLLVVVASALVVTVLAGAPHALAQERIDKPVKILVGFAAGGTADLMARVVADKLRDSIGQPVILDNRPAPIPPIPPPAAKNT